MLKELFKEKGNNIVRNMDLRKIRKGIKEEIREDKIKTTVFLTLNSFST